MGYKGRLDTVWKEQEGGISEEVDWISEKIGGITEEMRESNIVEEKVGGICERKM